LNVFMESQVEFTDEEHGFCQALADVATIAILQNQAAKEARNVNGRLQRALDSRITVEQAMSILAERFTFLPVIRSTPETLSMEAMSPLLC
jgi:hypothetical protein